MQIYPCLLLACLRVMDFASEGIQEQNVLLVMLIKPYAHVHICALLSLYFIPYFSALQNTSRPVTKLVSKAC